MTERRRIGLTLLLGLLLSCAAGTTNVVRPVQAPSSEPTICAEPRPQMCTRQYRPVCAELQGGGSATRGNACSACADENVVSYVTQACG